MTDTVVTIRAAEERDTETLLQLIRELAEYEGQAAVCMVEAPALRSALFGARPLAQALLAEVEDEEHVLAAVVGERDPLLLRVERVEGRRRVGLPQIRTQVVERSRAVVALLPG